MKCISCRLFKEFKHLLVEDNAINKVESEVLHSMQHLRNEIGFEFEDYNETDNDDIYDINDK